MLHNVYKFIIKQTLEYYLLVIFFLNGIIKFGLKVLKNSYFLLMFKCFNFCTSF